MIQIEINIPPMADVIRMMTNIRFALDLSDTVHVQPNDSLPLLPL